MADEQDKKLKAEKSLNLRLMKQLNTSLTKANDIQKDKNKSDNSLNKNISKLNTNIANINKLLSPSNLPKSLDNLNDKVKSFTKAFDARVIPNKLNRLSKNITNLNRLLETEVLKGFKNVSNKANRASKKASAGSSYNGAMTTPGKGFEFSGGYNTIYRNQTRGPMGLLGRGDNSGKDMEPHLNTYYPDEQLLLGAPGKQRKPRQPKGATMVVTSMLVKKALFESAVFKNAIFKGSKGGLGGKSDKDKKDTKDKKDKSIETTQYSGSLGARPEVEQKFQRLFPDVISIVKGQRKTQQQFLKQTPQQLFKELRKAGLAPQEARRQATRQARTRNIGASAESGFDVAKEQVMSGFTDFGVPDSMEAQFLRGIRGLKSSFKSRRRELLDPEQTESNFGTKDRPYRPITQPIPGQLRLPPGLKKLPAPTDLLRTDDKIKQKSDKTRNVTLANILKAIKGVKGGGGDGGGIFTMLKRLPGLLMPFLRTAGGLIASGAGSLISGAGSLISGAGSAIASGAGAVASGAGSLLAAGGTAVGAAGAATVAGVAAAAGAIGAGIGLTINEVMEKKFPEADKAVSGFFEGVGRFFSGDLDDIMKNNEANSKKLLDQNLRLFGTESVRLEKEADKLKQEARSARNEIFGLIGGDEKEAIKLEAKEKILRAQASLAGRKFYLENKTVSSKTSPLIKQSITEPTSEPLSKVEIDSKDTRKSEKEKFADFLLGEFIDTLVTKLNVGGGGDQQMPNNTIGINPNG